MTPADAASIERAFILVLVASLWAERSGTVGVLVASGFLVLLLWRLWRTRPRKLRRRRAGE